MRLWIALVWLGLAAAAAAAAENLAPNGTFEKGGAAGPAGWERPDGLSAFWLAGGVGGGGKAVKLDTDVAVADWERNRRAPGSVPVKSPTTPPKYDTIGAHGGAGLWSAPVRVERGQWYLLEMDVKAGSAQTSSALGPPMLCLRGYRQATATEAAATGTLAFFQPLPDAPWFSDPIFGVDRRPVREGDWLQVFRANLFCKVVPAQAGRWTRFRRPVQIRTGRFACDVVLLRIAAFWPPAEYWFDNVVLRRITPEEARLQRQQEAGTPAE
ncbi:MAG: hypothetical protein WC789_08310 [Lentisphaeria bacterium]